MVVVVVLVLLEQNCAFPVVYSFKLGQIKGAGVGSDIWRMMAVGQILTSSPIIAK